MGRVVMVTGVSRHLGGRFARLMCAQDGVDRVIGVDAVPPRHDLGGAQFVRADIRNPVIAKVIAQAGVDTVVHMSVLATPDVGTRAAAKEINVIGTMQLLAACQKATSVRRLVVKSSAQVYGVSARDPAVFTEEMEPRELPRAGFAKDSVEVEGYVRGFARRRPDVDVALFRFANIVGPGMTSAFTSYFSLPVVPVPLGFDGRLQMVHEEDALEVLRRGAVGALDGTFNVAGDGVLPLSQALRRAARTPVPVPLAFAGPLVSLSRRAGLADVSVELLRYLAYGRALDTGLLRRTLGFVPRFSTVAAFDDFAAARGLREEPSLSGVVERAVDRVLAGAGVPRA